MAGPKRDWQQEASATTHLGQSVKARAGDNSWRNAPAGFRARIAAQLGLLRIPVYAFIAAGLVYSLVQVVGWLKPVEPPRLTIISGTYRSPLLPQNTFATTDASRLIATGLFQSDKATATSQNREEILASIRGIGQSKSSGLFSRILGWHRATDFVYVNTLGITLPGADGTLTPFLLPEDFDGASPDSVGLAIPVTELLDAVAASQSDHKVVVFDCGRIEQLWSQGVLANQFVSSVEQLLLANADRYATINVVFSSSDGEVTHTDEVSRASAFGRFLTDGLKGAADEFGDNDHRVTLSELSDYLALRLPRWTGSQRNRTQHPRLLGSADEAEVVLALVDATTDADESQAVNPEPLLAELRSAWEQHDRLVASQRPTRFAPTLLTKLRQSLLRGEAALRARDESQFRESIDQAMRLSKQIDRISSELQLVETPWSLVEARRVVGQRATTVTTSVPAPVEHAEEKQKQKPGDDQPAEVAQPLLIPKVKEVESLADAVDVVEQYLSGDLGLRESCERLRTAHKHGVELFAEAELILMFAEHGTTVEPELIGSIRQTVSARHQLEQTAWLAPSFPAKALPWISPDIDRVAERQRAAEDALFVRGDASVPVQIGPRSDAETISQTIIQKHSRSLARAYELSERNLAELPFLIRAASVESSDDFLSSFAGRVEQLLRASHKLHFALNADPRGLTTQERHASIASIAAIADEVEAARSEVFGQLQTEVASLTQAEQLSEASWHRCDVLLSLPVLIAGESQNANTRIQLFKRLAKPLKSSETVGSPATAMDRSTIISRRERLASLWFSMGLEAPILISEPGSAISAELSTAWQRIYRKGHMRDGRSDLAVRQLGSIAPAGVARALVERAQSELCCWRAQRRMDDFWAGSESASDFWFAKSAGQHVAFAEQLHGGAEVESTAGRLAELILLAEEFGDTEHAIVSFDKTAVRFSGTDAEMARVRFRPTEVWPSGTARLDCRVADRDIRVDLQRGQMWHNLNLKRQSARKVETALSADILFRGHRCTGVLPVSSSDEAAGPTVVYEYDLPATGAISVQWANTKASQSCVLFVVDASGSMGQDGRMKSVQDSLLRFARAIEDTGVSVGVRVFGDRIAWDGSDPRQEAQARADTRLVLPVRPFTGSEFSEVVSALEPRGETPLFRALLDARNDFPTEDGQRKIVVISDGADNWALAGSSPGIEELSRAYADSNITIDAVGFQTNSNGYQQLQRIAAATGGTVVKTAESDELLKELFGFVGIRRYEVVDAGTGVVVDSGSLGRTTSHARLSPGDYKVRVIDHVGDVIAQHPVINLRRGEQHRLLYAGKAIHYARMNLNNDLAVVRDADSQTTLRVMNASRDRSGLSLSLALVRENAPAWRPRDVQFRVRPRGASETFTIRSLRPNVGGLHFPAWRCQLANWPKDAQFADVEVSWTNEEHAPRKQFAVSWETNARQGLNGGPTVTRQSVGTIRMADGQSRDVATLTLLMPDAQPGSWNFRFDEPPVFAQQVWNREGGLHTAHVQFESGKPPETFFVEAPIGGDESRRKVKATIGLRLRSIRQARRPGR